MLKLAIPAVLATLVAAAPCAAAGSPPDRGLALLAAVGGQMRAPLVHGDHVYVPTGRTLATWDYADRAAPRLASATSVPLPGVITGLARRGGHLYASWQAGSCARSGVAVFTLGNPDRPRLVGQVADYAGEGASACAAGLAVANDRLYLFDTDNGVYVGGLADPLRPALQATGIGHGPVAHVAAQGDLIWTVGRTFLFGTMLRTFDAGQPDAPVESASHFADGIQMFSASFAPPYAIGVGWNLSVLDIGEATRIEQISSVEAPYGAATGVKLGDHVYAGGYKGLDVWSIADPAQPRFVRNAPIRSFAAGAAAPLDARTALMLGDDDRLLAIDARRPATPRLASERLQPGGAFARDITIAGTQAVLLQQNYGLSTADPQTLVARSRFEARLPETMQARDFEDWAVDGDTAYLAAWGYGLIVVDLSVPTKPVEIGRLPFGAAARVAVDGDRVYLAKHTDGDELAVVDVSDRRRPRLLARLAMPLTQHRLHAQDGLLFIAEGTDSGTVGDPAGLRVLDLANPNRPVEVGVWGGDCRSAKDLAFDRANARLHLACRSGLRILDLADPAAPQPLGGFSPDDETDDGAVALRGARVWYAGADGMYEFDVADPALPRLVRHTGLAGQTVLRLRAVPDGRLFAFTQQAGVHIFGLDRLGRPGGPVIGQP